MATGKPEPGLRANQEVFADTLMELAVKHPHIVVVTSDSRGSGKLVGFGQKLPQQMVEVGIAEQSLVGMAAGLASSGKKPFAVSPACFLTARALEQIKNDVCYSNFPVVLTGISAGVSYGALGTTHHSIHDFAVLRTVDNITIVAPADAWETAEVVRLASEATRPVYIRLGKFGLPSLHKPGTRIELGRAVTLGKGQDMMFIATGETVCRAVAAAKKLEADGISAGVISMHTVKPLDKDAVLWAARSAGAVITVEEHSVNGGLGEACAAVLMEAGAFCRFRRMGLPDEHTVAGSQDEILSHYGISENGLAEAGKALLGRVG